MANLLRRSYNPDVLTCLANLSNDEVFTPPELANQVLDLLPEELWSDPTVKILDPFCKSGVFLREAARRFIKGLEPIYPDLQERVDHIMHEQLFGIAITELTSLLSRRSLYCSKFPNGHFSVSEFDGEEGNIRYRNIQHTWSGGKCVYCGASQESYERSEELEQHAYEFIHIRRPGELWGMNFDVIVGNPPYQLGSKFDNQQRDRPIYHLFVQQAKKLRPRYLTMIIPARWFTGTWNLGSFPAEMLHDRHITQLHDFPNSSECFPGVEIKGGVCYFLWERDVEDDCLVVSHQSSSCSSAKRPLLEDGSDIFIRDNAAIPILERLKGERRPSFSELVSPQNPFGFNTAYRGHAECRFGDVLLIRRDQQNEFVSRDEVRSHGEWIDAWKVLIPEAGEGGSLPNKILGKPFVAGPGTCCTGTFMLIGPFDDKNECLNAISYIQTTVFRYLVSLKKITQHTNSRTYSFVPIVSFAHAWTDEMIDAELGIMEHESEMMRELVTPLDLDNESLVVEC